MIHSISDIKSAHIGNTKKRRSSAAARMLRRIRPLSEKIRSIRNDIARKLITDAVAAYWYPERNFGDQMTPDILRHFGKRPLYASLRGKCEMVCIGSILEIVPEDYGGIIAGAGFISASTERRFPSAKIALVRGRMTADKLGLPRSSPVGDPGIIADRVYPKATWDCGREFLLGIVPHYRHLASWEVGEFVRNNHVSNVRIIDVRRKPRQVVRDIARCEYIASSSLHGLIVAHSLGIPALAIEIEGIPLKGRRHKFMDYFSVYDMRPVFYSLNGDETCASICRRAVGLESRKVAAVKSAVLQAYEGVFGGTDG